MFFLILLFEEESSRQRDAHKKTEVRPSII